METNKYPTGHNNTIVDFTNPSHVLSFNDQLPPQFLRDMYDLYFSGNNPERRETTGSSENRENDDVRGSPSQQQSQRSSPSGIILRHSVFLLILNLISIEFLFDSFYFVLKVLPIPLNLSLPFQNQLWPIYFGIFGVLLLLKIILMVFAAIQWVTSSYEIRSNEIRYRYGIFSHHEKMFLCSHTQEVTYTQGLLGRLFNFGSIEVYSPVIKDRIYLASIPNPQKYAELIKGYIPDNYNINYYPYEQQVIRNNSKR